MIELRRIKTKEERILDKKSGALGEERFLEERSRHIRESSEEEEVAANASAREMLYRPIGGTNAEPVGFDHV